MLGEWMRPRIRGILRAAAAAAMVVSGSCAGPTASESASATASATSVPRSASSVGPLATPTVNTRVLDDRFGFLVASAGCPTAAMPVTVRAEGDPLPVMTLDSVCPYSFEGAPSPDGTRVASATREGAGATAVQRIRVFDALHPQIALTPLLTFSGVGVTSPVWSDDGTGLAFTVARYQDKGETVGPRPARWSIRTFDLATRELRELAVVDGPEVHPLAWSKATGVVGAIRTGANGAFAYLSISSNGDVAETRLPSSSEWFPIASPDGGRILVTEPRSVRVWPIDSYGALRVLDAVPGDTVLTALFMPGSDDLVVVLRVNDEVRLELWGGDRRHAFYRTKWVGAYPHQAFTRVDGSAVVLSSPTATRLIDVATGAAIDLTDSGIFASVRLRGGDRPPGAGSPTPALVGSRPQSSNLCARGSSRSTVDVARHQPLLIAERIDTYAHVVGLDSANRAIDVRFTVPGIDGEQDARVRVARGTMIVYFGAAFAELSSTAAVGDRLLTLAPGAPAIAAGSGLGLGCPRTEYFDGLAQGTAVVRDAAAAGARTWVLDAPLRESLPAGTPVWFWLPDRAGSLGSGLDIVIGDWVRVVGALDPEGYVAEWLFRPVQ